ncbi:hypothetical protein E2C01_039618 [Portunus trituberculatus]|uniref:Uncharacterized protein n=1 Tax=Portunus trituberculatus TaxID=210409 RepID=A0A5B7FHB3_PORTR|nr:hypothetical protein [Portunus trituberculatus]
MTETQADGHIINVVIKVSGERRSGRVWELNLLPRVTWASLKAPSHSLPKLKRYICNLRVSLREKPAKGNKILKEKGHLSAGSLKER